MSKLAILVVFCLALTAYTLDVSRYETVDITESDIAELFTAYLVHLAPVPLKPTVARYEHFRTQVHKIIEHNRNPHKTWTQTITKFTGLTMKELEGFAVMAPQNCSATNGISAKPGVEAPIYWDWRQFGIVSPVKDQGHCGSCWTFSTTGAVEAHWAILQLSRPLLLSEQQLVDCAGDFNNHGCNGGLPSQAFEYIRYAGGLQTEHTYPYQAKDGKCTFEAIKVEAIVPYGSANITSGDEDSLLQALITHGPVSIAFEVTSDFGNYQGGVYVGSTCHKDTQHVNHAVLAVGFGHDAKNNIDYWIVKNSWSNQWGEEGYFRIQRGTNMCGLAVCAAYPQIRQPKSEGFLA